MENWRYKARTVTKYNPLNYNSEDVYMLDEWTSRSDIGKGIDSITKSILTNERYSEVENNYINAVKTFIAEVNAKKIRVVELHKISDADDFDKYNDRAFYRFYSKLEEREYDVSEIDIIVKLALREYIQVAIQLITPAMDCTVYFGYDYYMYFVSDTVDFNSLQNKLMEYQMYVK